MRRIVALTDQQWHAAMGAVGEALDPEFGPPELPPGKRRALEGLRKALHEAVTERHYTTADGTQGARRGVR